MEDDYNTTIAGLKGALNGSNSGAQAAILGWLGGLKKADGTTPAGDDDPIIIKHPK